MVCVHVRSLLLCKQRLQTVLMTHWQGSLWVGCSGLTGRRELHPEVGSCWSESKLVSWRTASDHFQSCNYLWGHAARWGWTLLQKVSQTSELPCACQKSTVPNKECGVQCWSCLVVCCKSRHWQKSTVANKDCGIWCPKRIDRNSITGAFYSSHLATVSWLFNMMCLWFTKKMTPLQKFIFMLCYSDTKIQKNNQGKWYTFEPVGNHFQKVVPFQKVIVS